MASFIRGVWKHHPVSNTRKASGQLEVSADHLYVVVWIVMMDDGDDNNDEDDEDDKNDEDDKDDVAMVDVNFR